MSKETEIVRAINEVMKAFNELSGKVDAIAEVVSRLDNKPKDLKEELLKVGDSYLARPMEPGNYKKSFKTTIDRLLK